MNTRFAAAALLSATLLFGACEDATGPGVEPEIRNVADSFEFQVSKLDHYTGTLSYTWSNGAVAANVNQATSLTGGTAQLTILDARGNQLYSRSLTENGTFVTTSGQAGSWTLRVAFSDASGTSNFRVQKRT